MSVDFTEQEQSQVTPSSSGGGGAGLGGGNGSDGVEDEGLGSETKIDRPSSAKGYRRRMHATQDLSEQALEPVTLAEQPFSPSEEDMTADATHMVVLDVRTAANRSPSPPAPPMQGLVWVLEMV